MLQYVRIQNFKGIKSGEVKDLRRINLFIGKNDTGKSTIFEATYYTLQEYYSPRLQTIMNRRADVFTGGSELWFKYETRSPIILSTLFQGIRLDLTIEWRTEHNEIWVRFTGIGKKKPETGKSEKWTFEGNRYRGADFSFAVGAGNMIYRLPIDERTQRRLASFIENMILIDCTLKSSTTKIESRLSTLKIKGKDKEFGVLLEDTYGKGTEWEFLPHQDSPGETRLAIREAGRLTYFSDFGDGMRYGLGILGTAMSVKNTAIFIEEIESHQHLGSLRKLLKNLVQISRNNNLQIFISTHNADVWNSLSRGVYIEDSEREKEEFRCYVIERDPASGVVTTKRTDDVVEINRALGVP